MKKTVLFFLMIILIASCHQEEIPSVSDKPEGNFPTPANLKNVLVRRGFIYGTMFGSPKTHQRLVQLLK